jgi:hypothetical protein
MDMMTAIQFVSTLQKKNKHFREAQTATETYHRREHERRFKFERSQCSLPYAETVSPWRTILHPVSDWGYIRDL